MIKFFRKIRQKLVQENRVSKYLIYAFGEILLVMIGILLALQVNNWNNKRIETKREYNYIKNIERDLNNQLLAIDTQIEFEAAVADNCNKVLEPYNETNTLSIDNSFALALGSMTSRRTFRNPNPAYKELISSGSISLISDEEFKNKLINYYEELNRIEQVIANNNTLFIDQEFIPIALKFSVVDLSDEWKYIFKNYERQFSAPNPLSAKNMTHLLAISKQILEDEANELQLVNHLSTRESYAMVHMLLLTEFKLQTEKMIKAVRQYYD